jgi:hypothetical protein
LRIFPPILQTISTIHNSSGETSTYLPGPINFLNEFKHPRKKLSCHRREKLVHAVAVDSTITISNVRRRPPARFTSISLPSKFISIFAAYSNTTY